MAFLSAWGRSALWGDSAWAVAGKLLSLLIIIFGLPTVLDEPVPFFIDFPWGQSIWKEPAFGTVLAACLAIVYAIFTAGLAWVRSRGPVLEVGTTLIADTEMEMFRLQVRNSGEGVLVPKATLLWIERNGAPDHPSWMPLELRWTHHPPRESPALSWNEAANVDICQFQQRGTWTEVVVFMGDMQVPHVALRPLQRDYSVVGFGVRVTIPGTRKFTERAFSLEPDQTSPLGFRPVRLTSREN